VEAFTAWDHTVSEVHVGHVRELKFEPDGIRYQGQSIPLDQATRSRLFDTLGAPARYWRKHTPSFQARALSEHTDRGDFGSNPTLVLRDGKLVTIVRGELIALPNGDVLRAVEEAVGIGSEGLKVTRVGADLERLDIEIVSPLKGITIRPGDIVQSGLHVSHHRFGTEATVIEAFIFRLVCSNGMTRRECVSRDGIVRTRKLPVDFPNGRDLQLAQVRRLAQQNWNGLQAQLEALKATSDRAAHVEELLTRWLQRARISVRAVMPRLLSAWREEGAEKTYYGAVNALTRVATHDPELSERQRRVLASLGGVLAFSEIHVCPRCFSVLAAGTGNIRAA
jgi:hypothetical protein